MKVSELQNIILNKTGLKTSVKYYKNGSMKGYVRIFPIYQNKNYPSFPHDFITDLKKDLLIFDSISKPVFCTISDISIYGIENDRIVMKKERKNKSIDSDSDSIQSGWGSKNSQMRLDKAASRYAKRLKNNPNCARYY